MKTYDFRGPTAQFKSSIHLSVCAPRYKRKWRTCCETCKHLAQYEGDLFRNGRYERMCDAKPFTTFSGRTEAPCRLYAEVEKED